MKLISYIDKAKDEEPRVGAMLDDEKVLDLKALYSGLEKYFDDMLIFLDHFEVALPLAQEVMQSASKNDDAIIALQDITLLSPVPRPRSIRDCMTFKQHYIQAARTFVSWRSKTVAELDRLLARLFGKGFISFPAVGEELPIYYKSNALNACGPDDEVRWPSYTKKLDFELEFGVFLGKGGRDIPVEQAEKHIAGYCIFNDYSARDQQIKEMAGRLGPTKGKDFDTGNVLGPWLVTADEVPDPKNLHASVRVNGQEWVSTSTKDMSMSFAELISYISKDETLHPGEFIGSGTLPGGCGLELDRWIQPGDVVELTVEGLGILRNRIAGY